MQELGLSSTGGMLWNDGQKNVLHHENDLLFIPAKVERLRFFSTHFIVVRYDHLDYRFHVAVRLFSNRSQMTSKCGKNKKVTHEAIAECVTDVLTTF